MSVQLVEMAGDLHDPDRRTVAEALTAGSRIHLYAPKLGLYAFPDSFELFPATLEHGHPGGIVSRRPFGVLKPADPWPEVLAKERRMSRVKVVRQLPPSIYLVEIGGPRDYELYRGLAAVVGAWSVETIERVRDKVEKIVNRCGLPPGEWAVSGYDGIAFCLVR